MTDIEIRRAGAGDAAYIISTWLNHFKDHSYFAMRIKRSIFFKSHHKVIERILLRDETRAYVAHPSNEPDVIFGFLVMEDRDREPVIHFAFVKEELRLMGIGRALLYAAGVDLNRASFTHWTFTATELVKRYPSLIFNPYFT